jgi:glycosyltransferase involved in cell wall biosynthesis
MTELIEDGRTGFLVADVDAAVAAVDRAASLDRAAIRFTTVERFGVERMVDEYVAAYEEIVRSGGARFRGRPRSVPH